MRRNRSRPKRASKVRLAVYFLVRNTEKDQARYPDQFGVSRLTVWHVMQTSAVPQSEICEAWRDPMAWLAARGTVDRLEREGLMEVVLADVNPALVSALAKTGNAAVEQERREARALAAAEEVMAA